MSTLFQESRCMFNDIEHTARRLAQSMINNCVTGKIGATKDYVVFNDQQGYIRVQDFGQVYWCQELQEYREYPTQDELIATERLVLS